MSERVMSCIEQHCPNIQVYSIDEAFVEFGGMPKNDVIEFSKKLRKTVTQWTGIPVCVGIGPTKTLAKMANALAKKNTKTGVFSLQDQHARNAIYKTFLVNDIWGIGRKTTAKLNDLDIFTVQELIQHPAEWIRKQFGLGLTKTVLELQGTSCIQLDDMTSKKAISSSRSFSRPVTLLSELSEALSTYTAIAARKCRDQHGLAQGICIYIMTSRFKEKQDYYAKQKSIKLTMPSNDTQVITAYALTLLKTMFRPGFLYAKCGIILLDIVPETYYQADIFSINQLSRNNAVMETLDRINRNLPAALRNF